jgi:hypothetical protein
MTQHAVSRGQDQAQAICCHQCDNCRHDSLTRRTEIQHSYGHCQSHTRVTATRDQVQQRLSKLANSIQPTLTSPPQPAIYMFIYIASTRYAQGCGLRVPASHHSCCVQLDACRHPSAPHLSHTCCSVQHVYMCTAAAIIASPAAARDPTAAPLPPAAAATAEIAQIPPISDCSFCSIT